MADMGKDGSSQRPGNVSEKTSEATEGTIASASSVAADFKPVPKKLFVKLQNSCITQVFSYTLSLYEDLDLAITSLKLNEATLERLCHETCELRKMGVTNVLPLENLLRLLKILVVNVKLRQEHFHHRGELRKYRQSFKISSLIACSCISILNLLTSSNMPKRVYLDEIIEEIVACVANLMRHMIAPWYNCERPVSYQSEVCDEKMLILLDKIIRIMDMVADLVEIQSFDVTLQMELVSSVMNHELWIKVKSVSKSAFRLIGCIFREYPTLQADIFEKILADTRGFTYPKTYKLRSGECVRVPTILVLHLLQNIAAPKKNLYENICPSEIRQKIQEVNCAAKLYIRVFLGKYQSRSDGDYRKFFENFLDDVITLSSKPEWAVARDVLELAQNHFAWILGEGEEMHLLNASLEFSSKIAGALTKLRSKLTGVEGLVKKLLRKDLDPENTRLACEKLLVKHLSSSDESKYYYFFVCYQNVAGEPKSKRNAKKTHAKIPIFEEHKTFLLEVIRNVLAFESVPNYDQAQWLKTYLSIKGTTKIFEDSISSLLMGLEDAVIAVRTMALKCLATLIQTDTSLLEREDIKSHVKSSIADEAASVREACIDLLGKSISTSENLDRYYRTLLGRISDPGLAVGKRAIRILCEICLNHPDFDKIPEISFRIMASTAGVEEVQTLVLEVFQKLWFPSALKEAPVKIHSMVNIITYGADSGLNYFQDMLRKLITARKTQEAFKISCENLVSVLVDLVLKAKLNSKDPKVSVLWSILHSFATIEPRLLLAYAKKIQSLLASSIGTRDEKHLVIHALKTLESVVFLMEKSQEKSFFLALEDNLSVLSMRYETPVISTAVPFLSKLVNKISKNYKLIRDMFRMFFNDLKYQAGICDPAQKKFISRSIFTVGILLRYFDFKKTEIAGDLTIQIPDEAFRMFLHFLKMDELIYKTVSVNAISSMCIRHSEFLLDNNLRYIYKDILVNPDPGMDQLKLELLSGLEAYLVQVEISDVEEQRDWSLVDLNSMDDVSSGMSSTIIQNYTKEVLEAYLVPNVEIRKGCFRVVSLVLRQGLVYPIMVVTYLIGMATERDENISKNAAKLLIATEEKYPGFVTVRSGLGMRVSFKLQKFIQGSVVRGVNQTTNVATNETLYHLMNKTRQHRRALVLNMLKNFDDKMILPKMEAHFEFLVYLADNLAAFPYSVLDEVLFVMHNIDTVTLLAGTGVLHSFHDALQSDCTEVTQPEEEAMDIPEESLENLLDRVPNKTAHLVELLETAEGCILLTKLKKYLGETYGVTDSKLQGYSPFAPVKTYEKPVKRRSTTRFDSNCTFLAGNLADRKLLARQYLDFKEFVCRLVSADTEEFSLEGYVDATKMENKDVCAPQEPVVEVEEAVAPPARKTPNKRKRPAQKVKRRSRKYDDSSDSDSDPSFVL